MRTRHRHETRCVILAATLLGALLFNSIAYGQTAFECKPTAYPVQNFKKAVDEVQADTKELSELYSGPAKRPLDNYLSNSLAIDMLRSSLKPLPPFYSNMPVQTFLQRVWDNSTIFNWEGDRGTAATLGRVTSDLRTRRQQVLTKQEQRIEAINRVITDSEGVAHFFDSARGLLQTVKNGTQSVQETYLKKAFDHLDACLATCGGPRDFNLSAFKVRFDKLYGDASGKNFETNLNELKAGKESVDSLAKDLKELRSRVGDRDNLEASQLQKAADILSEAKQNGSWATVGKQNEKILSAIGQLNFGYRVDGKPVPTLEEIGIRVDSTYNQAQQTRRFINPLLTEHGKLVDDLKKFLAEYNETYTPGCRATKR